MSSLELKTLIDKMLSDIATSGQGNINLQTQINSINNELTPANTALKYVKTNAMNKIDRALMPDGIDDIETYPTFADFPTVGLNGIIYLSLAEPLSSWRWGGSFYVNVSGGVSSVNSATGIVSLTTDSIPISNDKNYISTVELDTIDSHTTDINQMQINLNTNNSAITDLQTLTDGHTTDIISLQTVSAANMSDIAGLQSLTTTHTADILTNSTDIQTNLNSINDIFVDITTINNNIAQNELDISSNTAAITSNTTNINTNTNSINLINISKGAANGLCPLDGGAKIPIAHMPVSIMTYKGVHDVITNTPTLSDATGVAGYVYNISVAGSRDYGSGVIVLDLGDWLIHNGVKWEKSDNSDDVTSVNGKVGSVLINSDDISDVGYTNKWMTTTEKTAITTNASNIATNTADISDNTSDINALTTVVGNLNTSNVSDVAQINKYTTTAEKNQIVTNTNNISSLSGRMTTAETDITNIETDANIMRYTNAPTNNQTRINQLNGMNDQPKFNFGGSLTALKTNMTIDTTNFLEFGVGITKNVDAGKIYYTNTFLEIVGSGVGSGRRIRFNDFFQSTAGMILTSSTQATTDIGLPSGETSTVTGTTIWDINNNAITVKNGLVWEQVLTNTNLLNKVSLTTANVAPSTNRVYLTDTEKTFVNPTSFNTANFLTKLDAGARVPRNLMPQCRVFYLNANNNPLDVVNGYWFRLAATNLTSSFYFSPSFLGNSYVLINPYGEVTVNLHVLIDTQPITTNTHNLFLDLPLPRGALAGGTSALHSSGIPCGFLGLDSNRPCYLTHFHTQALSFTKIDGGYSALTQSDLSRPFRIFANYTYLSNETAAVNYY